MFYIIYEEGLWAECQCYDRTSHPNAIFIRFPSTVRRAFREIVPHDRWRCGSPDKSHCRPLVDIFTHPHMEVKG